MDMADFKTAVEELSQNCRQYLSADLDEKKTENWLVEPLIADLGFNIHSPEVVPEYKAGVRGDYDHMVDYALFTDIKDPSPVAIIECKALRTNIDKDDIRMQLRQYFQGTESEHTHIAILTDGNRFLFFTDSENPNLMDADPYWKFKLSDIKDEDIEELEAYSKCNIDGTASHLKDKIAKLKERRFARELKESLDRGSVPPWLVEATENELKNRLNCRLTASTKQKLEPEVKGIWKEIWGPGACETKEDRGKSADDSLPQEAPIRTAKVESTVSLAALVKSGNLNHIKIESCKLGKDPERAIKNTAVSTFMASCISDLEREDGLLSKFRSELPYVSEEKKGRFKTPVGKWYISTNYNNRQKMHFLSDALKKVGRDPEELQIKLCGE